MSAETLQIILSLVSVSAACTSAYFAYVAIKASKKNAFLKERHKLALAAKDLYIAFNREWQYFRIDNHQDKWKILMSSEYFVSAELYASFQEVIIELRNFDVELKFSEKDEKAHKISKMLENIQCDKRLDE
ncbi:hypothetical protein KP803_09965 [Vibrio sp. ZSDE26]|uniref:Uncharacterized protein n=1 Tax=Vibrio amylolyticus TaxID=2847292 RepID=A0A9X1XIV5_9VIBR|nr:hypothetical protein [Vibrio amylolyticus]MCK6263596.1 hypothetical protein [Vibrio amylolyticus]